MVLLTTKSLVAFSTRLLLTTTHKLCSLCPSGAVCAVRPDSTVVCAFEVPAMEFQESSWLLAVFGLLLLLLLLVGLVVIVGYYYINRRRSINLGWFRRTATPATRNPTGTPNPGFSPENSMEEAIYDDVNDQIYSPISLIGRDELGMFKVPPKSTPI